MAGDGASKPFPWATAMAFGLGVLKLPPKEFWAMTPRELAAAMEGQGARQVSAMDRGQLAALMHKHPDIEKEVPSDG